MFIYIYISLYKKWNVLILGILTYFLYPDMIDTNSFPVYESILGL